MSFLRRVSVYFWGNFGASVLTGMCGVEVPSDAATFFLAPPFGGLSTDISLKLDCEGRVYLHDNEANICRSAYSVVVGSRYFEA
jgi:hypothetical protein